jgi:flagellar hook-basal body complex protein FliE
MEINTNLDIASALSALSSTSGSQSSESDFSDILSDAISNVQETESENDQGTLELLAGADTSIHETVIEAEKAELALELALQVRSKVIDAYNEIMRMQL